MEKLSSQQVAEILGQVGPALRALSEENQRLMQKLAFYQKRDRVEKLASRMLEKNLNPENSYEDNVESLMAADDLDVVEKAVELAAPQIKLAALSDLPGAGADAEAAFAAGILGD